MTESSKCFGCDACNQNIWRFRLARTIEIHTRFLMWFCAHNSIPHFGSWQLLLNACNQFTAILMTIGTIDYWFLIRSIRLCVRTIVRLFVFLFGCITAGRLCKSAGCNANVAPTNITAIDRNVAFNFNGINQVPYVICGLILLMLNRIFDYMFECAKISWIWISMNSTKASRQKRLRNHLIFWWRDYFFSSPSMIPINSTSPSDIPSKNVDDWYITFVRMHARALPFATQCTSKAQMKTLNCSCLKHHECHCKYIQINGNTISIKLSNDADHCVWFAHSKQQIASNRFSHNLSVHLESSFEYWQSSAWCAIAEQRRQ